MRPLCPVTIPNGIRAILIDRDTGRWKLDPSETQRRREVFWELYVQDSWQVSKLLSGQASSDGF
jgi:hypothetical protein